MPLTCFSNRIFRAPNAPMIRSRKYCFLIDLDGLKIINDRFGHASGDALLCAFAQELNALETEGVSVYRLGGDEFTILADKHHEAALCTALTRIEKTLTEQGFSGTGVSFGIAYASESISADDMLILADRRMYENKISRRRARATDLSEAGVSVFSIVQGSSGSQA
jgi:FOG: GGDEF domain